MTNYAILAAILLSWPSWMPVPSAIAAEQESHASRHKPDPARDELPLRPIRCAVEGLEGNPCAGKAEPLMRAPAPATFSPSR